MTDIQVNWLTDGDFSHVCSYNRS